MFSINSRGVVGITGGVVEQEDIYRAIDQARAIATPQNREIIHVIQRGFNLDGQEGIQSPVGMFGYRLEVETHIITAAEATVENLRQCVQASNIEVSQFVLNPLASAEVVLDPTEREMGVCVCDIGGGTADLAIYINGDVWHTMVLAVGGNHITQDISVGLRVNPEVAEQIKKTYGHAIRDEVPEDEYFPTQAYGEDAPVQIHRRDLAHIIEARVEEMFQLLLQEIKRSGYDGLLPAGGPHRRHQPAPWHSHPGLTRTGYARASGPPEGLVGLVDQLNSPSYSTSVGLLKWAQMMEEPMIQPGKSRSKTRKGGQQHNMPVVNWEDIKKWLTRLLPYE
jgi:cell division protein FtsA